MIEAAIVGIAGLVLSEGEAALFRAHPPAGVILFSRNVENTAQLAALTASVRAVLPDGTVLMVDQEGGRVARLRPPHWRAHPPAARIGQLYEADPQAGRRAAWLTGALIGLQCAEAGFDVVAAPVLDRRVPGASDAIGDRAYAEDPEAVGLLGAAMANGLLAAGIQPVAKHLPGHGQALVDSHLELPRVDTSDLEPDVLPFRMNRALPWAITAHILYIALDAERPATLSPAVISQVIRKRIGFAGWLWELCRVSPPPVPRPRWPQAATSRCSARASPAQTLRCWRPVRNSRQLRRHTCGLPRTSLGHGVSPWTKPRWPLNGKSCWRE
jgi:beta-N-acetylhexosaminidase